MRLSKFFICFAITICSRGQVTYNGKRFVFHRRDRSVITWEEGKKICNGTGATMANVYSEDHYNALTRYIRNNLILTIRNSTAIWIGMTCCPKSGKAFFENGTDASFFKWYPGYPASARSSHTAIQTDRSPNSTDQDMFNTRSDKTCSRVICEISSEARMLPVWRSKNRGLMNGEYWACTIECIHSTKKFWTYTKKNESCLSAFVCRIPEVECSPENENKPPENCMFSDGQPCNKTEISVREKRGNSSVKACERFAQTRCPPLEIPRNGAVDCTDGNRYGSICDYTCDHGYHLFNYREFEYRVCESDRTWSRSEVDCEVWKCTEMPLLANGRFQCSNGFLYNSVCQFTCNLGYALLGNSTTTCLTTGWTSPTPICSVFKCPEMSPPVNGRVQCSNGRLHISVCQFTCNHGYTLRGSSTTMCLATGWTNQTPICSIFKCPAMHRPANGRIRCSDGFLYNSVCQFTCNRGYTLQSSSTTTCLTTGWTNQRPFCSASCSLFATVDLVFILETYIFIPPITELIRSIHVAPDYANFAFFRYDDDIDRRSDVFLKDYPGNRRGLIKALRRMPYYPGFTTSIGRALVHVLNVSLSVANGNRPYAKDIVVLITFKDSDDDVRAPIERLRAKGVEMLVFAIGSETSFKKLRKILAKDKEIVILNLSLRFRDEFLRITKNLICRIQGT